MTIVKNHGYVQFPGRTNAEREYYLRISYTWVLRYYKLCTKWALATI